MSLMPVTDAMFLAAESREHPMHVGGLQLFTPPEGAGPEFAGEVYQRMMAETEVSWLFRKRPGRLASSFVNLTWDDDTGIDLDYHVRRSALPQPRRIRELLHMTSRLHGALLDRHRPLWELHIVEGLADGRFAVYTKIHHALLDGVSALRSLESTLTEDPDARDCGAPWAPRRREHRPADDGDGVTLGRVLSSALSVNPFGMLSSGIGAGVRMLTAAAELAPATVRVANTVLRESDLILPMTAPRTMLNVPIGGARRFAAQSWELERLRRVAKETGGTVNDVVLAMCGGALRQYLLEQNALPDAPLIAMVPVSTRSSRNMDDFGGNAVGAVLCNLGTDRDDATDRLSTVRRSMSQAKLVLSEMTPLQALLVSALTIAPLGLGPVPGYIEHSRPPFNVIISNVPGPKQQMYWNGARLDGVYPASIAMDGLALNITLASNGDTLDFGIVGCRRQVPSVQRILVHLEAELIELEKAVA